MVEKPVWNVRGQRPLLLTQGCLSPWGCLIVPAPSAVIFSWGRLVYFRAVSRGSGCSEDLPRRKYFPIFSKSCTFLSPLGQKKVFVKKMFP